MDDYVDEVCIVDWQYAPREHDNEAGGDEGTESTGDAIRYRILKFRDIIYVRDPTDYEPATMTRETARHIYQAWSHFGRYFEDVADESENEKWGKKLPSRLVLTAEARALFPEDVGCRP